MLATSKVIEAARKDRNRFLANPRGLGYLTRAERWTEAIIYCRQSAARAAARQDAAMDAAFGPVVIHD